MSSNRLMPKGGLRVFPRRISKLKQARHVLAWPFEEIPSLPRLCPQTSGERWRTRVFAVSIPVKHGDAEAFAAWLTWVQRRDCLFALDDAAAGRWLVRAASPITIIAGPDGSTQVRMDLECVEAGPTP